MQSEGDDFLPGVEQTAAEVEALSEGPVAEAMFWAERILDRDIVIAWPLMDDALRLATAQDWIHSNRDHPAVSYYDRDALARDLSQPGCLEHPLWPGFCLAVLSGFLLDLTGWDADQLGFFSRPRPVAPDYMVVLLGQGTEYRVVEHSQGTVMYPFLMHYTDAGWRIARAGADTAPVPGWPPQFPPGRDIYRIER